MAEGLVAAMARAYRDPRAAMARQVADGLTEPRALMHLFLACSLAFVASVPGALRRAQTLGDVPEPLAGVISAHLFGFVFVAPLLLYGLAALLHITARGFGARGDFLAARSALFWAALLGAPIALALSLVQVLAPAVVGPARWLDYPGYVGLAFWLWLLAASLAEAEGFRGTRSVAAALALGFGGLAVGLAALTGAGPVIG